MSVDKHVENRRRISPLRAAMYDFSAEGVRSQLQKLSTPDSVFRLGYPLGDMEGADTFYEQAYAPLLEAWPDLERRDMIVVSGRDTLGHDWVGCCGHYMGTFEAPWLDIPATGQLVQMRFHEFYRMVDGFVVETQMLWDIPEVMQQANAWPMTPALGKDGPASAPADGSGINDGDLSMKR